LKKHSVRIFTAAVFLLLYASCASAPRAADPLIGGAEYLPLNEGALAYMVIDAKAARPIIEGLSTQLSARFPVMAANEKQSKQILDRTGSVAAAVYDTEKGGHLQAAAWGRYPAGRAGISFAFSRNWKKKKSGAGYSYWYSERSRMSLALSASQVCVSMGMAGAEPPEPAGAPPGTRMPADFAGFRQGSALALWLPEPQRFLDRFLQALALPLQIPAAEVFAALRSGAEDKTRYEALVRIRTPSPSQARALVSLFTMARIYIAAGETDAPYLAAVFFGNPPVQDGQYITIQTAEMDVESIALLFELFTQQER
jgi:hypothetical protein